MVDHNPPDRVPRCNCGAVSEWHYDPDYEEWYQCICWRCLEIKAMKNPEDQILQAMLPWTEDKKEAFIELIIRQDTLLKTVTIKKFEK